MAADTAENLERLHVRQFVDRLSQEFKELRHDIHRLQSFRFTEAVSQYLAARSLIGAQEQTEYLNRAVRIVKQQLLTACLSLLSAREKELQQYHAEHPGLSPKQAARLYFFEDEGTRIWGDILEATRKSMGGGADSTIPDTVVLDRDIPNNVTEDSIPEILNRAFEEKYGKLSDKASPPPPDPEEIGRAVERAEDDATEGRDGPGEPPVEPAQFQLAGRRGGGLYAFTWWRVKKDDAALLRDGNHYPRNRGDLKPHYTETANKHLANLLAGLEGKEEGRVNGYYLGWMGLSPKGFLEGRANGMDVPRFVCAEDEVVMLGVARIKKFDLFRLRFNGFSGWNFDWSQLHFKWDVWDPTSQPRDPEGPGEIKVRVVQWADEEDNGFVKAFISKLTSQTCSYEEVVTNPTAFTKAFETVFDTPNFQSFNLGLKAADVEIVSSATPIQKLPTDANGYASWNTLAGNMDIELVAVKKGFCGISGIAVKNANVFAPKAPVVLPIEKMNSFNNDTLLPRRIITTIMKKDGTKKVLIILQKAPKTGDELGEPIILVKPNIKSDQHDNPLVKPFGSILQSAGKTIQNFQLSFTIKKNRSMPIPWPRFYYYLFLGYREDSVAQWKVVQATDPLQSSIVKITARTEKEYSPGLYICLQRDKATTNYWDVGGRLNEGVAAALDLRTSLPAAEQYRLYCLALKEQIRSVADLANHQDILDGKTYPAQGNLWDYNYIDFTTSETEELKKTSQEAAKAEEHRYKDFKEEMDKLEKIIKEKGNFSIKYLSRDFTQAAARLWVDLEVSLKEDTALRGQLQEGTGVERKTVDEALNILYSIVWRGRNMQDQHLDDNYLKEIIKKVTPRGKVQEMATELIKKMKTSSAPTYDTLKAEELRKYLLFVADKLNWKKKHVS
jgi:hypothetical protein